MTGARASRTQAVGAVPARARGASAQGMAPGLRLALLAAVAATLPGCAVVSTGVAVVSTAATVAVGAASTAVDVGVGAAKVTGKAIGKGVEAVTGSGSAPPAATAPAKP